MTFIESLLKAKTPERVKSLIASRKKFSGEEYGRALIVAFLKEKAADLAQKPSIISPDDLLQIQEKVTWTESERLIAADYQVLFQQLEILRNYLRAEKELLFHLFYKQALLFKEATHNFKIDHAAEPLALPKQRFQAITQIADEISKKLPPDCSGEQILDVCEDFLFRNGLRIRFGYTKQVALPLRKVFEKAEITDRKLLSNLPAGRFVITKTGEKSPLVSVFQNGDSIDNWHENNTNWRLKARKAILDSIKFDEGSLSEYIESFSIEPTFDTHEALESLDAIFDPWTNANSVPYSNQTFEPVFRFEPETLKSITGEQLFAAVSFLLGGNEFIAARKAIVSYFWKSAEVRKYLIDCLVEEKGFERKDLEHLSADELFALPLLSSREKVFESAKLEDFDGLLSKGELDIAREYGIAEGIQTVEKGTLHAYTDEKEKQQASSKLSDDLQRKLISVLRERNIYRALGEVYGFDFSILREDISELPSMVAKFNRDLLLFLSGIQDTELCVESPYSRAEALQTFLNQFRPIVLRPFMPEDTDDISPLTDLIKEKRSNLSPGKTSELIALALRTQKNPKHEVH